MSSRPSYKALYEYERQSAHDLHAAVGEACAENAHLERLLALADKACGILAENAAHDLDHGGYRHPAWYRAVRRFRSERVKHSRSKRTRR